MQVLVLFYFFKRKSLLCLSLAVARDRLADLANVTLKVLDLPIIFVCVKEHTYRHIDEINYIHHIEPLPLAVDKVVVVGAVGVPPGNSVFFLKVI